VGWLFVYATAGAFFVVLGLLTLLAGLLVFLLWSWRTGGWPFGTGPEETTGQRLGAKSLEHS
jgi:hypothetical protein